MSTTLDPSISIHSTLGAVFIGFAFACVVFGVVLTQIFSYFRNYPGDRFAFKATVAVICILEIVDQAFIGHIVYHYSVSNFARVSVLLQAETTWSLILQLTAGAIVGFIVKFYFGLRVWRFSNRNIFVTGLVMFLTFAQLGLALAFTVEAFKLPNIFAVHDLQALGTTSLAVGVATDIVTATALCYFLSKLRTGLKTSDSLVNALCSYAINTGVLTSTLSVATLVLYNAMPTNNLYFVATYFILSKLYAISLNTRRQIRGRGTEKQDVTTNNTNMFHLGTRMPSMAPTDLERWDVVYPPVQAYSGKHDSYEEDYGYSSHSKPPRLEPGHSYAV
ncbi:hypothetical protein CC1G_08035 [Coprinopsis cinerea okayama7|uniref:DUF6534 domain-containing protein n=1 Tax=Coprinopsis cinerea (strain Okayama-7 / 130 / ATCC MYA-4618 / FGSC 9003) TaxID=240176 RepID=A8NQC5_COPC7|nr:hypothetical protein CC1G_08035 [Coprinopsis cinerea okayama7\|eukprot:XP_001835526.2 hypothetical protein CC1G_08035 [Coprinopsis cinerea okayama7\